MQVALAEEIQKQTPNGSQPRQKTKCDLKSADQFFQHANQHFDNGNYKLAIQSARTALSYASSAWEQAPHAGLLLFKLGDFHTAGLALLLNKERTAKNVDAILTLAAIQTAVGEHDAANTNLKTATQRRPFQLSNTFHEENPTIVRARFVDHSKLTIHRNADTGLYGKRIARGHFSIQHLVDKQRFNMIVAALTEGSTPPVENLVACDLFLNTVSCPDLNATGLHQVAAMFERMPDTPVINSPHKVLRTSRRENYRRLSRIDGVVFPRTERMTYLGDPQSAINHLEALELGYPVILRRVGSQTGISMVLAETRAEAVEYFANGRKGTAYYAVEYLDCRGKQGFFHKTRAFFIDGKFYPVANLTNDHWQIHSNDRYRVMSSDPWAQDREKAYLNDPLEYLGAGHLERLHHINQLFGLDFFGVDFTIDKAGRLVIFEANAAMRHNFDHVEAFPYTGPHLKRITAAFNQMIDDRLSGHAKK